MFGTSSGEIEFHKVNLRKKRLEIVKDRTLRATGSVLCMQKVKFKESVIFIIGLSSGDIVLSEFKISPEGEIQTRIIGNLKKVHDFGVNSLDAMSFKRSVEVIKKPTDQNQILIASGGDDQQLAVHNILLTNPKNWQMKILSKFKRAAHTSCVKGILLRRLPALPDGDRNSSSFEIQSASYDQRLKYWHICVKNHYHNQKNIKKPPPQFEKEESKNQIKLQKTSRNCLSDINNVCKSKEKTVLVG